MPLNWAKKVDTVCGMFDVLTHRCALEKACTNEMIKNEKPWQVFVLISSTTGAVLMGKAMTPRNDTPAQGGGGPTFS